MIENSLLTELGCNPKLVLLYQPHLEPLAVKYEVNTPFRISHFLAQVLHESGRLYYTSEIWGPTKQQRKYERDFTKPWNRTQKAFELGNYIKGDGRRYCGKGLIQTTGRSNVIALSEFAGVDYVDHPEWIERPYDACLSAYFFWTKNKLNALADKDLGRYEIETHYNLTLKQITKKVNGGYNGINDRQAIFDKCVKVIEKYI